MNANAPKIMRPWHLLVVWTGALVLSAPAFAFVVWAVTYLVSNLTLGRFLLMCAVSTALMVVYVVGLGVGILLLVPWNSVHKGIDWDEPETRDRNRQHD